MQEGGVSQLPQLAGGEVQVAVGPLPQRLTTSASPTVRSATRNEWPDVVGSRDSMAVTDAFTNPSKDSLMLSYSRRLASAAAACDASEAGQAHVVLVVRADPPDDVLGRAQRAVILGSAVDQLQGPSVSPGGVRIGTTSIDIVRSPACSSNQRSSVKREPGGGV